MDFHLIKRNMVVRSIRKFFIKERKHFSSVFRVFNVVSPLLCSFVRFHHFDCVFHERSDFLFQALLLISSDSSWLEILSKLNQTIISSHYFFLRCCCICFIVFKVFLPLRIIIRLLEYTIVACSHTVVHHLIKVL